MRAVSKKRKSLLARRAEVRAEVLERDGGCRGEGVAPGTCGTRPDRVELEVHELTRGAGRGNAWLDPSLCIALCPFHHDWVTLNPGEAIRLGLAKRSNA